MAELVSTTFMLRMLRLLQKVVLGEFLVNSVVATVWFDSGASHSFISSSFAEKHKIPTILLKLPL
jgi:hypothetical protein